MIGLTYKCCSGLLGLGLSKTRVIGRERGLQVDSKGNLVRRIKYLVDYCVMLECQEVRYYHPNARSVLQTGRPRMRISLSYPYRCQVSGTILCYPACYYSGPSGG